MSYEDYVNRAVQDGYSYEELPNRVRMAITWDVWRLKLKDMCIQKGLSWSSNAVESIFGEQEYYTELMKTYKQWQRWACAAQSCSVCLQDPMHA